MSVRLIATIGLLSLIFVVGLFAIDLGSRVIATSVPRPPPAVRTPTREPENQPTPEPTVSFFAVGDIMLSRTVDERMDRHGDGYPFEKTRKPLTGVDFAFGNLESPIVEGREIGPDEMSFRADPGAEKTLFATGFRVLSLANNHTPNFGAAGLQRTLELLDEAGIEHAGAGSDAEQARQPAIIEQNGLTIAFLAYNDTDVVPDGYAAGPNRAGTVFMDIEPMRIDVERAKVEADLVIVSMHSGTEYVFTPNVRQTSFARAAIDAGADLVIGHHPHVVQPVERYNGKLILYSLGNFIFDQMWSRETREGMMARIVLETSGVTDIRFLPVVIDDYAQPRPATEVEAEPILKRLGVELDAEGRFLETP